MQYDYLMIIVDAGKGLMHGSHQQGQFYTPVTYHLSGYHHNITRPTFLFGFALPCLSAKSYILSMLS